MSFKLLRINVPGDQDGLLYPVVVDGKPPIRLDSWDGQVAAFGCTGLELSRVVAGERQVLISFRSRKVDLMVTDARVAVASPEWNKGARYWGIGLGATTALVDNTRNKWKEAKARAGGRIVVGHARYGWVTTVGWSPRRGRVAPTLSLGTAASEDGDELRLDVFLSSTADAGAIARTIAQKVAIYRLDHDVGDVATFRDILTALASGPPLLAPPAPGKLASYRLPAYVRPSVLTAIPSSSSAATSAPIQAAGASEPKPPPHVRPKARFAAKPLTVDATAGSTDVADLAIRLQAGEATPTGQLILHSALNEDDASRYVCEMELRSGGGLVAAGTAQLMITRQRILGLIVGGSAGDPRRSGHCFAIDRELGLEFRIKMNWRDRPANIAIRPKRSEDADFSLLIGSLSLVLEDDGGTRRATLNDLSKRYEKTFSNSW